MLLLLLLLQPLRLLPIRCSLKCDASNVQQQSHSICDCKPRQRSKSRSGNTVDRQHGHQTQRHPSRLGEECHSEFGGRASNTLKSTILSILSRDASEEEAAQSSSPESHSGTEDDLSPVPGADSAFTRQTLEKTGPCWTSCPGKSCEAGADGGKVEGESGAGNVGKGAREVVESLCLGEDGGDGYGGLDAVCEAYRGDQSAEEGIAEVGGIEETVEDGGHDGEWIVGVFVMETENNGRRWKYPTYISIRSGLSIPCQTME